MGPSRILITCSVITRWLVILGEPQSCFRPSIIIERVFWSLSLEVLIMADSIGWSCSVLAGFAFVFVMPPMIDHTALLYDEHLMIPEQR
jgi:hypothetical protein